MNVRVEKSRKNDPSRGVILSYPGISRADPDDPPFGDRDLSALDLPRKHIENLCIFDDQIAFFPLHRAINEMFHRAISSMVLLSIE